MCIRVCSDTIMCDAEQCVSSDTIMCDAEQCVSLDTIMCDAGKASTLKRQLHGTRLVRLLLN